jgi:hypothetical protein
MKYERKTEKNNATHVTCMHTTSITLVTMELYIGMLFVHTASEIQFLGQQKKSTNIPPAPVVLAAYRFRLNHLLGILLVHRCQQTVRKNYTPTMSTFQKVTIFQIIIYIMIF